MRAMTILLSVLMTMSCQSDTQKEKAAESVDLATLSFADEDHFFERIDFVAQPTEFSVNFLRSVHQEMGSEGPDCFNGLTEPATESPLAQRFVIHPDSKSLVTESHGLSEEQSQCIFDIVLEPFETVFSQVEASEIVMHYVIHVEK